MLSYSHNYGPSIDNITHLKVIPYNAYRYRYTWTYFENAIKPKQPHYAQIRWKQRMMDEQNTDNVSSTVEEEEEKFEFLDLSALYRLVKSWYSHIYRA